MFVDEIFETLNNFKAKNDFCFVGIFDAFGKILAEDIRAKKDLPAFDNSALDGYAFNYEDIANPLKIKGSIYAGDKNFYEIQKNECYRLMTGGIFPKNSDSLVMMEKASFDEDGNLLVPSDTAKNNARKIKGEEVKAGDVILQAGEKLNSSKIMLLASQGISHIKVYSSPKIAVFSSGDEINEPWETCDDRGIYNANALGIISLLKKYDLQSEYKGIIRDKKEELIKFFNSCQEYDLIITSGGAGPGDKDFMHEVLLELGFEAVFTSIDLRPARPTKLYHKNGKFISILPGNPMSCLFGAFLSTIPLARKLGGENNIRPFMLKAKVKNEVKFKKSRSNIVIGNYDLGEFEVLNDNKFSPAMITPLIKINSFYISTKGEAGLESKQEILIYKFEI